MGEGGGGGVLERKSDPTQERSDPPISVAARANYCTRGSSMRYIKLHKGHVGEISGTPCCSSKGCALMPSLTIVLVCIFPPFVKKNIGRNNELVCLAAVSLMR